MNYRFLYLLISIATVLFAACDNTKHLAPGQSLYIGSDVKIKANPSISKSRRKALESDMTSLIRPKPNSKILGIRLKLTLYNSVDTPRGKGLRYLIKNKLGEPPVIASYSTLDKDRVVMQNRLENRGWFNDTVTLDTIVKHRKFTGVFTAYVHNQYTLRNISFPKDTSVLSRNIVGKDSTQKRALSRSLLRPNDPYDLDLIKLERERIDARLKQRGFYYFGPDYLFASVDTTVGNHKADVAVKVKEETPDAVRRQYRINDIIVYADYSNEADTSLTGAKKYHGYTIVDPNHRFNPRMFVRTLVFDSGDLYNRDDHNLSLNRLTTLGVYRFVKARFLPDPASDSLLNAYYYLTPTQKKSLRFQVSGLTKSDNSNGGELSVNWRDRSLFKGAELLTITAYGGLEKQFSAGTSATTRVDTRRLGAEADLYVPRIISPFNFHTNSSFVPHTKFMLGYELFNRSTQYLLTTYRGSYGYVWKENTLSEHQLNLINISSVQPTHITPNFQDSLKLPKFYTLGRSIEKQFIIGPSYNYNYNTLNKPGTRRKNDYYFNGNLDLSAPLVFGGDTATEKQKKLFATPLSQYIRTELEFRYTRKLGANSSFNSRLWGGLGYAYGNSYAMPYIKAFFAGGTNDIRAFRARTLGPGTYYAGNPRDSLVVDQPGDIKLEANAEYRAKLFSIVRGALFMDAGNVWTLRYDSNRPGSQFSNQFLKQIGVGMGAGLRFDASILVLRLDVAFPVRLPYNPDGQRWVFDKINFGDKDWRRNNLVFNLAIGYPF